MKTYLGVLSLAVFFICFIAVQSGHCGLENCKNMGLYGGTIQEIAIDASSSDSAQHAVYARMTTAPIGIYKKAGSGEWTKLGFSETPSSIGVTQDDGYVYVGTTGSLYKSTDGGVTWSEISDIQESNCIRIGSNNRIYAAGKSSSSGSAPKNIYYSDDDGVTWTTILTTGLDINSFYDFDVSKSDNNYVWAAIKELDSSYKLYRWTYSGGAWSQSTFDLTSVVASFSPRFVTIDPNYNDIVYIGGLGGSNSYMIKTVVGTTATTAADFSQVPATGTISGYIGIGKVYIPTDSSCIYSSGYKLVAGATSWTSLGESEIGPVNSVIGIKPGDNNTVYTTTDQGIAISTNAGTSFSQINDGLEAVQINGGVQDPNDGNILYIASDSGIGKSTDGGTTWNFVVHGVHRNCIAIDPASAYLYANSSGGDVQRSTDGGSDWQTTGCSTTVTTDFSDGEGYNILVDPVSSNIVYNAVVNNDFTKGGLYKGTRSGITWTWSRITGTPASYPIMSVNGYASSGTTVLFAGYGDRSDGTSGIPAGLLRSTDGGASWTNVSALSGYIVRCITIDSGDTNRIYVGTGHDLANSGTMTDNSGTVFVSTDAGVTWTNVAPNSTNEGAFTAISINANDHSKIYASCANKIYASTNYGASGSWYEYFEGASGELISSLCMFTGLTTTSSLSSTIQALANRDVEAQTTSASLALGTQAGLYLEGASTTWYLAEGCTNYGYDEWILIQNPGESTANVTVTFYKGDGNTVQVTNSYTGTTRNTIHVNAVPGLESAEVSAKIVSTNDVPVIVERAMYKDNMATGADTIGITGLSNIWYFAEGCTASSFNEWILLMNPQSTTANVTLTYMMDDGTTVLQNTTVNANSRKTITVNSAVPDKNAVSTKVDSDLEIAAERSMERNNVMHVSIGTTAPSSKWYFAEGCTKDFATYICIQNPSSTAVNCTVTFNAWNKDSPYDSKTVQMTQTVLANSRSTIHLNSLKDSNGDYYFPHHDVATCVDAGMSQVIAESAMYWGDDWIEGHATIGSKTLGTIWYFAEGCTAAPFDLWILLQNPTSSDATVTITYAIPSGSPVIKSYTVPANSRYTIHVDSIPGLESTDVSAKIESNIPIAAERAMYFNEGGHCSIGLKG